MAQPVVWLRAALDELDDIAAYIARDSPAAAASVVRRIREVAAQLGEFSHMGPRIPELDEDDLRQRIVYSYRLLYRVKPERIEILALIHGARLLPADMRHRAE